MSEKSKPLGKGYNGLVKILAVSHSCIVDVNQRLFIELNRLPDTQVELVVPYEWVSEYDGKRFLSAHHPEATFPIHHVPVVKPGHITFHCYPHLPMAAIRRFAPDVIYSTQEPWSLSNLQFLLLAKQLKVPFFFHTNQNLFKNYPPPFRWFEQLAYKTAATALSYSEEARQVMIQKGLKRPSLVIPYATSIEQFQPGQEEALRQELGLTDSLVVGYMGRFVVDKGIDLLVEALTQLPLSVKLLLVGSGAEEARLRALAQERGVTERVVFAGAVLHNQADRYMRCLDILVLPSRTMPHWKEQFGRVLIEALACHIPVVGSDSGEIPNVIRDTGGGLVFKEGSVEGLTACLKELVASPERRAELVRMGVSAVHYRYTFEAVARKLRSIFAQSRY